MAMTAEQAIAALSDPKYSSGEEVLELTDKVPTIEGALLNATRDKLGVTPNDGIGGFINGD